MSVLAIACGPRPSALTTRGDNYSLQQLQELLARPLEPGVIATVNKSSLASLYAALVAHTNDAPFTVDGVTLSHVHTTLVLAAPLFAAMHRRFPDLRRQMTAGAVSLAPSSGEAVGPALAALARAYATGEDMATSLRPLAASRAGIDEASAIPLAPQAPSLRNLAAVAALAIVHLEARIPALGLVTNALSGSACDAYKAVVKLTFHRGDGNENCSGVFLESPDKSHDYLLTSSHCVLNGATSFTVTGRNGWTAYGDTPIPEPGAYVAPNGSMTTRVNDNAVIPFPPGTAADYAQMASDAPAVGSAVTLAGTGNSSDTGPYDTGPLRCGTNTAQSSTYEQGMIKLAGIAASHSSVAAAGTQSSAAPGDSGSPIFDSYRRIVGINSGGDYNGNAQYTDITGGTNHEFIVRAIKADTGPGKTTQSSATTKNTGDAYPICRNGSNNGDGWGWDPGVGGPNNGSCHARN